METFYPTHACRDVLVLLIEDERVSRKALARLLAESGYTTEAVGSAEEAMAVLAIGLHPSIALVDLDLPGMSGADLLGYMAKYAPEVRSVLVTAACEERLSQLPTTAGIRRLRKPIDFNDLLQTLDEKCLPA